jgi:hypothetical protein
MRTDLHRQSLRQTGLKASGKLAYPPELTKALLVANRLEDQLVVTKLDRLGRSLEHLIELSKILQDRAVDLVGAEFGVTRPTIYRHLDKTTP